MPAIPLEAGLGAVAQHCVAPPSSRLIEPGRVHRRVYTDPDIFELEMDRIFGRAWLFVGHASQVPKPGDYITTDLGRQP